MMVYEYKTWILTPNRLDFYGSSPGTKSAGQENLAEARMDKIMNELAQQGWEYIGSASAGNSQTYAILIFRRLHK